MDIYYRKKFGEDGWEKLSMSEISFEEDFEENWKDALLSNEIVYTEDYIYRSEKTDEPTLSYTNIDIAKEIIVVREDSDWIKIDLVEAEKNLKGYGEYLAIRLSNGEIVDYPGGKVKLLNTEECPSCGAGFMEGAGALSRRDNETWLCSDCGQEEAMSNLETMMSEALNK